MDLDDVILEVLAEYEVELGKRDFKELINLCFSELEEEGEISETILQEYFTDLDIEPSPGMISEIIYRIHELADESVDDIWNMSDTDTDEEV
jgi:hypothetical protein